MSHKEDWMPSRTEDRITLMYQWREGLDKTAWQTAYGWTAADCNALIGLLDDAINAHTAYVSINSTQNRIAKDEAMDTGVQAMRKFGKSHIRYNEKVPATTRYFFGFGVDDTKPTPGGTPETRPDLVEGNPLGGGVVEFRFKDEAMADSWAIPAGCNGCVLMFHLGTEQVTEYALLDRTELMTNHIYRLNLPPDSGGLWLSVALCWQSTTGHKGPPSEIRHFRVL